MDVATCRTFTLVSKLCVLSIDVVLYIPVRKNKKKKTHRDCGTVGAAATSPRRIEIDMIARDDIESQPEEMSFWNQLHF